MVLRDFLYLDRPIVRQFLAQIEGGEVDELTEHQTTAGKSGLGATVGPKALSLSGEKSKEKSLETEAVVRQVGASEFDRLYGYLESEGLEIFDEITSPEVADKIRRKSVIEVDARFGVSGLQQMLSLIGTFTSIAPLMERLGSDVSSTAGGEAMMEKLRAFSALGSLSSTIPVVGVVPGDASFKLALELDPQNATVEDWAVDATVLLKVQRLIKPHEKYLVGDPLGGLLKMVPEQARAELIASVSSPELRQLGFVGDSEVSYPALVGTPIAIYR